ncbi:MAG: adenylate/guanylate cyclase domain-containing protein [Alphaproteobacteria bacterium]|nr:MAG: adenylate/guanylate cyclase domain-containing protein [Alphaproteobacteria bacterium]
MVKTRVERRLAAILAADVAGYSRLIGADEEGTLARFKAIRGELVDPKIDEHYGRIVKTTGDGLLAEFSSVIDALRCAIEVQAGMTERNAAVPGDRRIEWRIGINVGDIVVEDGDIFGDGVNIAARLESLAEPGGICVSARVQEDADGKLDVAFEDAGEQQLHNITRPVRVYRVGTGVASRPSLPLPDKPSIAVLAFTNMSCDPEQEFFADGISEDIITVLSKSRSLFVIARHSSFTYKGKKVAVNDIGRELGVRYVLEGSVRKVGSRVRVTAQLIEAATGGHLWAERYDRDLADIFSVQDEITTNVSEAIQPALERSERERAARKPPDSLDAWESYHRGMWHFANVEASENENARSFFRRAIEIDPRFAPAEAALALTYLNEITLFRPDLRVVNLPRALDHAGRAIKIDVTDATAHAALARALWMSGRHAESLAEADLAVSSDPNSAVAHGARGGAHLWAGRPRDAIAPLQTAMRLSPFDPLIPFWLHFTARAYYCAGDYVASIAAARQLRNSVPNFRQIYNTLIAALGQTGQIDEARVVMAEALERFGEGFRRYMSLPLNELRELRPEDREHMIDGFRKAGLVA